MAVENKYVNANVAAGKLAVPALINGDQGKIGTALVSVDAADSDGSIYRCFRVSANMIPHISSIDHDAITGGTSFDFGIYDVLDGPTNGAVKDKDALAAAQDLSSAGLPLDGLGAVSRANSQKRLWELAGDSENDHPAEYDLAITGNTVGTASGSIVVKIALMQG